MRSGRFAAIRGENATYWEECVRTATPLVYAAIAKSPVPFIALVAFPVTVIRRRLAYIAKESNSPSTGRIVAGHQFAVIHGLLGGFGKPSVFQGDQDMWCLACCHGRSIGGRKHFFKVRFSRRPETRPAKAPSAQTITAHTYIELAAVTVWTVLMEVVLDVRFFTPIACY